MAKKVKLDKRWKEVLFAAAGFGPNVLMTLMMAYFTDAVIPTGLIADIGFWSYGGVTLVQVILFPILWTIGRIFDGLVDVPLAAITDNLKNKTGKRWISIVVSIVPMIVSFVLCWIPVFGMKGELQTWQQICNSIWIFFWSIVFFASYTLGLITFYGSLSDVCENQTQRARVSAYKSVFDTINYALVYAAIPAIFKAVGVPIWQVAIYGTPLMLTILIPLFMQTGEPDKVEVVHTETIPIGTSIALTVKSKPFMKWTLVNCISFFGLQMFLVAQNTLISGLMGLGAGYAAILNTCAFAPVPLMLFLFNKLRKSKGVRIAFQTALLAFGISIFSFCLGSRWLWGDAVLPKLLIGCTGSVIASWGIGAFFMVPYLIPTAIASVEEEITGKNHSGMYFAVQALATSAVGAIASSLVYNYLKLWVEKPDLINTPGADLGWRYGVSLVPVIVSVTCIIGFFACFFMPKRYTPRTIYSDIKASSEKSIRALKRDEEKLTEKAQKQIAEIEASGIEPEQRKILIEEINKKLQLRVAKIHLSIANYQKNIDYKFDEAASSGNEEDRVIEKSSLFATAALWVLTGGIFGIVAILLDIKKLRTLNKRLSAYELAIVIISLFVPFINIWADKIFCDKLEELEKEHKCGIKTRKPLCMVTSAILPLFMNVVAIVSRTENFNRLSDKISGHEN